MTDTPTDKKLSETYENPNLSDRLRAAYDELDWDRMSSIDWLDAIERLRLAESHPSAIREAVEGERARMPSAVGFAKLYRKFKTPCALMTDAQLAAEDAELDTTWKRVGDDDEGAAGSPGEWIIERSGEIETERTRRARREEKGNG